MKKQHEDAMKASSEELKSVLAKSEQEWSQVGMIFVQWSCSDPCCGSHDETSSHPGKNLFVWIACDFISIETVEIWAFQINP